MQKVFLQVLFYILLVLLIFFLTYYVNRKFFNGVLLKIADKIDPEGNPIRIDALPRLPQKEKLEFRSVIVSTPFPSMNNVTPFPTRQSMKKPFIFDE